MRLWSIHPKYLDSKGLVALWREALLAKHVLSGKTVGYKKHPQLIRFKNAKNSINAINCYLGAVHDEAASRGYNFDKRKINWNFKMVRLTVCKGQLEFEADHLIKKLRLRDVKKFEEVRTITKFKTHPLFKPIKGGIEDWEIRKKDIG